MPVGQGTSIQGQGMQPGWRRVLVRSFSRATKTLECLGLCAIVEWALPTEANITRVDRRETREPRGLTDETRVPNDDVIMKISTDQ